MTRTVVTPEIHAQIISLAKRGTPPSKIQMMIDRVVGMSRLNAIIWKARSDGVRIPYCRRKGAAKSRLVLVLSAEAMRALDKAAARRGVSTQGIATAVLETVCNDGIVDAVLDDLT
jgi:hypothetical protein